MNEVYVMTEGDELCEYDWVIAVFSSLEGAQASTPSLTWAEGQGLIGDYWFAETREADGLRHFYSIHPYTLDPDDLELG